MRLSAGLAALIALNSPAQDPRLQREIALGDQLARELRQNATRVDRAAVQQYVTRIGNRLAAQIPDSRSLFKFEVIAEDRGGSMHEAVAFPSGYVFVSVPLILAADSEAEFACMLARPMAISQPRNGQGGSLIWIGGENGVFPIAIERRADTDAIEIASSAGFDPAALGRYLARIYLSDARRVALQRAISQLPARTYTETGDFAGVQEELQRASPTRRPPSLLKK